MKAVDGTAEGTPIGAAEGAANGSVVVIGVGNPFRRDDGFGLAVLERLWDRQREGDPVLAGIEVAEESGEPVALISRWSGHAAAILIDAVTSDEQPGHLHRIECADGNWDVGRASRQASTHGLGVSEAVALGRVLGKLPGRLVIIGVETGNVDQGSGLTEAVAKAIAPAEAAVVAELEKIARRPVPLAPMP